MSKIIQYTFADLLIVAPPAAESLQVQKLALFLLGLKQDNVSVPKTPLGEQHEYHSSPHFSVKLPDVGIQAFNFIRSLLYND